MKKVITLNLEFDEDQDDDIEVVVREFDRTLKRCKKEPLGNITRHDCYHDEKKPCKNLRVIRDDQRNI